MTTLATTHPQESTDRAWITYGGSCYHADPSCPALTEGQAKARTLGIQPWAVISTGHQGMRGRRPCRACHRPRPAWQWTATDDAVLTIATSKKRPLEVIAGMLDRTPEQITARIAVLRLAAPAGGQPLTTLH